MRSSGSVKAVLAWQGRQVVGGDPVVRVDEGTHPGVLVDVQVVPGEDDGTAELLVCGDQQVAVVGQGETGPAASLVVDVPLRPVDETGAFAELVAGQRGDREPPLRAPSDPDDGCAAALCPGA